MRIDLKIVTGAAVALVGLGAAGGIALAANSHDSNGTPDPVVVEHVADQSTTSPSASPSTSDKRQPLVANVQPAEVPVTDTTTTATSDAAQPPVVVDPTSAAATPPVAAKVTDPATQGPNGGPLPTMQPPVPPRPRDYVVPTNPQIYPTPTPTPSKSS